MSLDKIIVRGAREHNLKGVDVDLPRDKLSVITGLSGSGKSSLAFDTIYAEGQRRYVESLSAYARQFLELMQKPDVDSIEGLSPAISIEQKTTSRNPRSTVGTVTEIYDYMRLMFARVGIPYSPTTGLPINAQTVSQMVDRVMTMEEGMRLYLLAPIVRGRKGEYRKEIQNLAQRGFQRIRIDGEMSDIEDAPTLEKKYKHDIEVVVDRIVVRNGIQARLADSFETALELADGIAFVDDVDLVVKEVKKKKKSGINTNIPEGRTVFSAKFACPVSGFTIDEIEPRLFSFNNPFGACPACDGLGTEMYFDSELIVPDETMSLKQGCIAPWAKSTSKYYDQTLECLAQHYSFDLMVKWTKLPEKIQGIVLYGSGRDDVTMRYNDGSKSYEISKPFEGVIPNMERRWRETDSNWVRDELSRYQTVTTCSDCGGNRLKPEALAVKIDGLHIGDVTNFAIDAAHDWFMVLDEKLTEKQSEIARRILREINERLGFLRNVGLDYLSLSRASGTLSGGESQRIRLASQIGSGLTGVLYVLDEPSIGLHQRDNARLLEMLKRLRDLGNTVIVVEHDEDAIRTADYLIDIGPGAGIHGGKVVAFGTPDEVMANPNSLTGQYLTGVREVPLPTKRRKIKRGHNITVKGARSNNLKNITTKFPLSTMTCITGVSGGGKSSLVVDTLYKGLSRKLNNARIHPGDHDSIEGIERIDKIVDIDQSPIGRTPRSNPATYTGAFTHIRDWFANLPEAKTRGYKPGRFSFKLKCGRCEACKGGGL
ncbi:MAG: excinuclease ABC subunit UvrA, partial [Rhodospirillales bacterium]